MEKQQQQKLSYEELTKRFDELYIQYQKACQHIQAMQRALDEKSFNEASFFVSMLFNVMEHPEMYTDDFVKWASEHIETALRTFAEVTEEESANAGTETPKDGSK